MYDHRHTRDRGLSGSRTPTGDVPVGRSTRVAQLAADERSAPAMFEGEPQWETIDPAELAEPREPGEPALPSAGLAVRAAAQPAVEAAAPAAPTADAVPVGSDEATQPAPAAAAASEPAAAAADPLHVGGHADPHAAPFEHRVDPHKHHAAPATDAYNRGTVHSDRATAHVFGRPGVVWHEHVHGKTVDHGLFQLKRDALRYLYTATDAGNVAIPFDTVYKNKLLSINSHAPHLTANERHELRDQAHEHTAATKDAKASNGRTVRLALNPSMPRTLIVGGTPVECVLSWTDGGGGGAAWLPIDALKGDTDQIRKDVMARARRENPSTQLPADPAPAMTPYVIRDDAVGHADAHDNPRDAHGDPHGRVLAPGARGGDNVSHYLVHEARGKQVAQGFVAICMNLPEGGTPPVAVDTALAGDTFFVFNDAKFHREVAVYENGAHRSNRRQMWVFGHLARRQGGAAPGTLAPDPHRAGWVPLRVLRVSTP